MTPLSKTYAKAVVVVGILVLMSVALSVAVLMRVFHVQPQNMPIATTVMCLLLATATFCLSRLHKKQIKDAKSCLRWYKWGYAWRLFVLQIAAASCATLPAYWFFERSADGKTLAIITSSLLFIPAIVFWAIITKNFDKRFRSVAKEYETSKQNHCPG